MDMHAPAVGADGLHFLSHSQMGARIRAHDWAATPLGPIERWPRCLRTVLGTVLASPFPMVLAWDVGLITLHNDAYRLLLGGKPDALGRPFLEVWEEARETIAPMLEQALTGQACRCIDAKFALRRGDQVESAFFDFAFSPIRDGTGAVAGVLNIGIETTAHVLARDRAAFRLTLEERLLDLIDPLEITRTAVALLGEHLGVDRAGYGEIVDDRIVRTARAYSVNGSAPLIRDFPIESFGEAMLARQRQGITEVRHDVLAERERPCDVWSATDTRSFVSVPLVRDGRLVATLYVNNREPRHWTPDEVALVEEVAARTWDSVERAKAEAKERELKQMLEKRIEEALAERKLLADVFETTDAYIQVLDRDYNILAINRANRDEFERTFGVRPGPGDNVLDVLAAHPTEREAMRRDWARALAGESFTITREFDDPRLSRRLYEITMSPLYGPEGELIGAYHFGLDVSELRREQERLKEAEAALRQSQKMEAMGQLTGGVAHDFNNLLTPIMASLDMLVRKGVGGERERRLIDGALQSAERAKTLVQRLLAFARRQPLQPTAVDVARVVESMADLIGSTLGPTIALRLELAPDLPPARADANQLEMALLNLAVNARDAMPEGGGLTITGKPESVSEGHRSGLAQGRYIRLGVRDTGVGMTPATLERAIEPFFSTKGVGQGTGLGLSMVHGLTAQLGGALTIDTAPGQGTSVDLWLPISPAAAEGGQRNPEYQPVANGRGRALLVDDEVLVRMSTADMLADLGFEVVEAGSAEEALQLIREGLDPDLLVTDHLMPGMSGAELVRTLKAERPELPTLIVSGYAKVEGIDRDVARLVKPFRNAELAASLSALMPAAG